LQAELCGRIRAIDDGTAKMIPAEEVFRDLARRTGQ
jgi:hypothetical protein